MLVLGFLKVLTLVEHLITGIVPHEDTSNGQRISQLQSRRVSSSATLIQIQVEILIPSQLVEVPLPWVWVQLVPLQTILEPIR